MKGVKRIGGMVPLFHGDRFRLWVEHAEPIAEILLHRLTEGEVVGVQGAALGNRLQEDGDGEFRQVIGRRGDARGGGMVRIASRRGGKSPLGRIGGSLRVEAFEGHGCVEGLERRQIEIVENFLTDSCPKAVEGMGSNGHTSAFPDRGDHFGGRPSFHERQGGSEAKEMSVGGGDLDAGNDQESIHRQTIRADQALTGQMRDRIAGIVVGEGDSAQSLVFCRLHHRLGGIAGIRRVVGVQMEIEGVGHAGLMIFGEQSFPAKHPEEGKRFFLLEAPRRG